MVYPNNIDRHGGDYYINSWKQVIAAMPKKVLIANWNNWNEENSIEGCIGSNGWKDLNGNPTYYWYLQITQSYSYIFRNNLLPPNIYVQEDNLSNVCFYNGTALLAYASSYKPNFAPIIKLPSSWLENHGYHLALSKNIGNSNSTQQYRFAISNYPNPFNPSTIFSFSIPEGGFVTLKLYDILGREIAQLVNTNLNEGEHQVTWSPISNSSGVYFYKLQFKDKIITNKILYIK